MQPLQGWNYPGILFPGWRFADPGLCYETPLAFFKRPLGCPRISRRTVAPCMNADSYQCSLLSALSSVLSPQSSLLSPLFSVLFSQSSVLSPLSSSLSPLSSVLSSQSSVLSAPVMRRAAPIHSAITSTCGAIPSPYRNRIWSWRDGACERVRSAGVRMPRVRSLAA